MSKLISLLLLSTVPIVIEKGIIKIALITCFFNTNIIIEIINATSINKMIKLVSKFSWQLNIETMLNKTDKTRRIIKNIFFIILVLLNKLFFCCLI